MSTRLAGCFVVGFVVSFRGFYDQSHFYGLCGDLYSADIAVNQGPDLLDVGLEGSFCDAGDLFTYSSKIFGFAATGDALAGGSFFSRKIANS